MPHTKLINLLKKYGTIFEAEKQNIEKYFIPINLKKNQILIEKDLPCNKLFFINNGLLRAFYTNEKGNEVTRMFAWENRFITNTGSFKNLSANHETIESVKDSNVLMIQKKDFDNLMKSSANIKCIYADILEEYIAINIRRFEVINTLELCEKFQYLKQEFPNLVKDLNDRLLASFIGISRVHFVNYKHLLYN